MTTQGDSCPLVLAVGGLVPSKPHKPELLDNNGFFHHGNVH